MLVKRIYVGPERREVEPERQEEHIEPAIREEQKEKIYRPSGGFNPNQEPLIRGTDAVTESTKLRISLEERVKLRRSFLDSPDESYVTTREVAAFTGISISSLASTSLRNRFPYICVGKKRLYKKSDVLKAMGIK